MVVILTEFIRRQNCTSL